MLGKPIIIRIFVAAFALLLMGGCSAEPKPQGGGVVMAAYSFRTLTADLGGDIRVPAVVTSAEQVLRDRGYTIASKQMTEDWGRVVGNPPGSRLGGKPGQHMGKEVVISAKLTGAGTRVKVTAQPGGDEAFSRAIMDDLLRWLGI